MAISATHLGTLVISMVANTAQYQRDLHRVNMTTEATMDRVSKYTRNASIAVTTALTAIGIASVREFMKFESSFAGVRKTVEASEATFQQLEKDFRSMAKQIPINVNELNRIGEAAGQLGIRTENIQSFTRVMADLGVATNMTSEQAASALARVANITGMAQTNFDRLGSVVVALGNNMATTESEIVDMSLRIAGAGSQVGMTEAQILSFAAALSDVGIRAEAGGTAISQSMIMMAKAVKSGSADLDQFAAVAGMSSEAFAEFFAEDAANAVLTFVEGLNRITMEGEDVFKILDDLGMSGIRMTDVMTRVSGASDRFARSLAIGSEEWEKNTALTEEAEKRYATFESRLAIIFNRVRDLAIVLGERLMPIVDTWITKIENLYDENGELRDSVQEVVDTIMDYFVPALATTATYLAGLAIMKIVTSFYALAKGIWVATTAMRAFNMASMMNPLLAVASIVTGIVVSYSNWNKRVERANKVNQDLNDTLTAQERVMKGIADFQDYEQAYKNQAAAVEQLQGKLMNLLNLVENGGDLSGIAGQRLPGETLDATVMRQIELYTALLEDARRKLDDLGESKNQLAAVREAKRIIEQSQTPLERYQEQLETLRTEMAKLDEGSEYVGIFAEAIEELEKKIAEFKKEMETGDGPAEEMKKMKEEADALRESLKTPFEKANEEVSNFERLLRHNLITIDEYNEAVNNAYGATSQFTGQGVGNTGFDLTQGAPGIGMPGMGTPGLGLPGMGGMGQDAGMGSQGPLGILGQGAGLDNVNEAAMLMRREEELKASYQRQQQIIAENEKLNWETKNRILQEMAENYNDQVESYEKAKNQMLWDASQQMADGLLSIAKNTAGEQSGIYKAMFAVSKAFAIAESIVKIQQGIANALSLGWPMGLVAAANVVSAASNIVTTIQSVSMNTSGVASYLGGGMTPSGPRTGGVDGQGGRFALLHPDEKVEDLKKERKSDRSGSGDFKVEIHNYSGERVKTERHENERMMKVFIGEAIKAAARDVETGGPLARSLESGRGYGLTRKGI